MRLVDERAFPRPEYGGTRTIRHRLRCGGPLPHCQAGLPDSPLWLTPIRFVRRYIPAELGVVDYATSGPDLLQRGPAVCVALDQPHVSLQIPWVVGPVRRDAGGDGGTYPVRSMPSIGRWMPLAYDQ